MIEILYNGDVVATGTLEAIEGGSDVDEKIITVNDVRFTGLAEDVGRSLNLDTVLQLCGVFDDPPLIDAKIIELTFVFATSSHCIRFAA